MLEQPKNFLTKFLTISSAYTRSSKIVVFTTFITRNHHNIRPYYQNHVSIFLTGDPCSNTSCPKGWTCTPIHNSIDFQCDYNLGNQPTSISTGKLSSIVNLRRLLLEEFSRHINFSKRNLCRGISIAVIFFASFFLITFLQVYHRRVKERYV